MTVQQQAELSAKEAYWEFVRSIRPDMSRERFNELWTTYLQLTGKEPT